AGHDAGFGVDTIVAAGQRAVGKVARGREHCPDELALVCLAEIDAELADDAGVAFPAAATWRPEGAVQCRGGGEEVALSAFDRAAQDSELYPGLRRDGEGEGGQTGGKRKLLQHWNLLSATSTYNGRRGGAFL